jgi:hypothetical protein
MLNWLNKQDSTATASTGHPQPPLPNWRNREQHSDTRSRTLEPLQTVPRKRRLGRLELFSFAVVVALIVGVDLYIFGINKRLSALEGQFVEVKQWAFPASLLEGKYASLNARVRALTDAYSGLNKKLASMTTQQQPVSVAARNPENGMTTNTQEEPAGASGTPGEPTLAMPETDLPAGAPAAGITGPVARNVSASAATSGLVKRAEPETPVTPPVSDEANRPAGKPPRPAADDAGRIDPPTKQPPTLTASKEPAIQVMPAVATDPQPAPASSKAGPWVINLLSDPNEALAARFAHKARDHGVTVEQTRAEVNGRVYWRVQISGFTTAGEAQARAKEVKERLNISDVWVFRQPG